MECGADALGFNLWSGSRRCVVREALSEIVEGLPEHVERVAVLVDPSLEEVDDVMGIGCVDSLQLHGHESVEFCATVRERGIRFSKAIHLTTDTFASESLTYSTESIVLDTASERGFGGTGKTFPWEWARRFVRGQPQLRVWLAGGLTPENVADAVRIARPFGVDVTTGVEQVVREKDRARMQSFVEAARSSMA